MYDFLNNIFFQINALDILKLSKNFKIICGNQFIPKNQEYAKKTYEKFHLQGPKTWKWVLTWRIHEKSFILKSKSVLFIRGHFFKLQKPFPLVANFYTKQIYFCMDRGKFRVMNWLSIWQRIPQEKVCVTKMWNT